MSSTDQKNITQHMISHCFTYGIVPTIASGCFGNYALDTAREPFKDLGETAELSKRVQECSDPVSEIRMLLPILDSAPLGTRCAPVLLKLTADSDVYYGNQAVMRFCHAILSYRWGMVFRDTRAFRQARRHAEYVHAMFAPGSYGNIDRGFRNALEVGYKGPSERYRNAAEVIDYVIRSGNSRSYARSVRIWCTENRKALGHRASYRTSAQTKDAYDSIACEKVRGLPRLPAREGLPIRFTRKHGFGGEVISQGPLTYIRIGEVLPEEKGCSKEACDRRAEANILKKRYTRFSAGKTEVFAFTRRDLEDLRYLLHAARLFHLYTHRREADLKSRDQEYTYRELCKDIWKLYVDTMEECGRSWRYRNKLGVYFDVLQWRYLAWRSGDEFYNHSEIMRKKLESKGLVGLPSQECVFQKLRDTTMDISIDLLGIYKASIYPEVDPFQVVTDQYKLHYNRHDTDWAPDSPEAERFELTRVYMWYFGTRVLKNILGIWPGKIREGAEAKDWHSHYHSRGVPSANWKDAMDIDLTGAMIHSDISNEDYTRQADSACAPPHDYEYRDFKTMRSAPRYHKRNILYAIQESQLPDLSEAVQHLNEIGEKLPQGYIDPIEHRLPFSTNIVTGSRCERHKDAPRPFYAASSPWGCILSYFDGITRDFLKYVPQSMLGKSTRQKFLDIKTVGTTDKLSSRYFFVSDDKAKYSPHMDPQSQQLPSEFFAEVFALPAFKAYGPIMYHCDLYYRVCGHLVKYGSNGTDREGMRGSCNTWLEIVAQGLATRLSRDKGLALGKSQFLSFIDDGLRKFEIDAAGKDEMEIRSAARQVLDEVIFGLRVLGRELSWDKTFVSTSMYVILSEIIYDTSYFSSGLKSFITTGDIEMKEVMSAADYEQLYFGKLKGAIGVGAPLDLCHMVYIYEVMIWHYKMGLTLQDNKNINAIDYRLFCMTPISLGGGGMRSMAQMACTEIANATREGIGNLARLCVNFTLLKPCFSAIVNQEVEKIKPVDFVREPEQVHVIGPRIRTQRVAAVVRSHIRTVALNEMSRQYMEVDKMGMNVLESTGRILLATESVSAEEVRLLYSMTPIAFVDEFIQRLASSSKISQLLPKSAIMGLRRAVRRDLVLSANVFAARCKSKGVIDALRTEPSSWSLYSRWIV